MTANENYVMHDLSPLRLGHKYWVRGEISFKVTPYTRIMHFFIFDVFKKQTDTPVDGWTDTYMDGQNHSIKQLGAVFVNGWLTKSGTWALSKHGSIKYFVNSITPFCIDNRAKVDQLWSDNNSKYDTGKVPNQSINQYHASITHLIHLYINKLVIIVRHTS